MSRLEIRLPGTGFQKLDTTSDVLRLAVQSHHDALFTNNAASVLFSDALLIRERKRFNEDVLWHFGTSSAV
jgi:hypothetical protein